MDKRTAQGAIVSGVILLLFSVLWLLWMCAWSMSSLSNPDSFYTTVGKMSENPGIGTWFGIVLFSAGLVLTVYGLGNVGQSATPLSKGGTGAALPDPVAGPPVIEDAPASLPDAGDRAVSGAEAPSPPPAVDPERSAAAGPAAGPHPVFSHPSSGPTGQHPDVPWPIASGVTLLLFSGCLLLGIYGSMPQPSNSEIARGIERTFAASPYPVVKVRRNPDTIPPNSDVFYTTGNRMFEHSGIGTSFGLALFLAGSVLIVYGIALAKLTAPPSSKGGTGGALPDPVAAPPVIDNAPASQPDAYGRAVSGAEAPSPPSAVGRECPPVAGPPAGPDPILPHLSNGPAEQDPGVPWPIVRVRQTGWIRKRKEVVRIHPHEVSLLRTGEPITDQLLESTATNTGKGCLQTIEAQRIRSVRVTRVGFVSTSSLWSRYLVRSDSGKLMFRVPDRDNEHVIRALRELAGDRFTERPRRWPAGGELFLAAMLLGSIALLALGVALDRVVRLRAWVPAWILLVFGVLGVLVLVASRSRSEYRTSRPPRRRWRGLRPRWPIRSPILGWSIKCVSLLYLLYLLTFGAPVSLDKGPSPDGRRDTSPFLVGEVTMLWAVPGIVALAVGQRLCLQTFRPRGHPDPRAPVLFLRAFDDDGKRTFQPTGQLAHLHGIFSYKMVWSSSVKLFVWVVHPVKLIKMFLNLETYTAEELLASAFRPCGPFVAIGRPGDYFATSGADRMYVDDAAWQDVVLDYLKTSQAVILQPAETDGVRWEMERVFAQVPRHRVLLSLLNFKDRPNLYEKFRDWLSREYGIRLGVSVPFQETPCFVYFEPGGTVCYQPVCYRSPLVWTFVGNAVDTARTFYSFVQGLAGSRRDPPREPLRRRGHATLSIAVASVTFGFLFLLGSAGAMLRYHGAVARDVVQGGLRRIAPLGARFVTPESVYRGKRMPYEFRLSSDWKSVPVPREEKLGEYLFEYQGGLGKLLVSAQPGGTLSDLYSESLPTGLRDNVERQVRQMVPNATITLVGDRWVAANGVQWREISLRQRYGPAAAEMKRLLFYSGPDGFLVVMILLPDFDHYNETADSIVSTIKAPETALDELLRVCATSPMVLHRGKRLRYSLSLRNSWHAAVVTNKPNAAGQVGGNLLDSGIETIEHHFELDKKGFAEIDVSVEQGTIPFDALDAVARDTLASFRHGMQGAMSGFRLRFDPQKPNVVHVGGQKWAEFRTKVSVSRGEMSSDFWLVQRATNHSGHSVMLWGRIMKDHPEIRRTVFEALDGVRFDD